MIYAIALALVFSAGGYIAWLQSENAQLERDVQTSVEANKSYIAAMHKMAQEQVRLNQQVIERDQAQRQIQRSLATTQRKLRDASRSTTITSVQRECLDSDIPGPVADILRQPSGERDSRPGSRLPRTGTLLGYSHAPIQWPNMGRSGGICGGATGGCAGLEIGQGSSEGVL
jgi:hypothetical protein